MSQGIFTFNAQGRAFLNSLEMAGIFFNSTGTFTNDASIASNSFTNTQGVFTPIEPFVYPNRENNFDLRVAGDLLTGATGYRQPRKFVNSTDGGADLTNLIPNSCFVYNFGTPPPPPANDYGFRATGVNSASVVVDARKNAFYAHPMQNGSFVRSATVSSMPSQTTLGGFVQPTAPNILFDQDYDFPPLIFVTSTTGPIAMNFMARRENGKYYGMSVVAQSTIVNLGGVNGMAAYQGNTYSFNYFIASPEIPVFGQLSSYGIRVFNEVGSKIFDSAYFEPSINVIADTKPTFKIQNFNYESTSVTLNKASNQGVCLNNFIVGTGHTWYATQLVVTGIGIGPSNIAGRFLTVSPTLATVQGGAANAIFVFEATGNNSFQKSFDYTLGVSPQITFLTGTFV